MNRRDFMMATALAAVAAGSELASSRTVLGATATRLDQNMIELTAVEAVAAIRRGEIGAENYAKALLSRAERLADLHTYIALNREGLIEAARAVDASRKRGGAPWAARGIAPVGERQYRHEGASDHGWHQKPRQ